MATTKKEPGAGSRWIIKGITKDGQPFRPSDWAERACGPLSRFENCRVKYSPLLYPGVIDGQKCVFIHPELPAKHPELFEDLQSFSQTNNLPWCLWEAPPKKPHEK